jgi:hypothetical protein
VLHDPLLRALRAVVGERDRVDADDRDRDVVADALARLGLEQPARAVDEHGRRLAPTARRVGRFDHRVGARQRLAQPGAGHEVDRVVGRSRLRLARRVARQHAHLVPASEELGDDGPAEHPGASWYRNQH